MIVVKNIFWATLIVALFSFNLYAAGGESQDFNHRDKFYDIAEWQGKLWIFGYPGHIYNSTDKGKTWSRVETGENSAFFSFSAFDEKIALLSGPKGLILRTEDGGKIWKKIETKVKVPLFGVQALKGTTHAWAVGHFNAILHSSDKGLTWERQIYQIPEDAEDEPGLNAIWMLSENVGWIVGEFGVILNTIDGGKNWYLKAKPINSPFYDLLFINDMQGVTVGSEGAVYLTTDGGENWNKYSPAIKFHLFSVTVVGESIRAVGQDGIFIVSEKFGDGVWKEFRVGVYTWLDSVLFLDSKTGFAVGGRGTILSTKDGGSKWEKISGR